MHGNRPILVKFVFCLWCLLLPLAANADEWRWSGIDRVVAVSDIHGAYDAFTGLLRHTGLTDADLNWSGGSTHLVIIGDILDRGAGSRRVLDLIRKLEPQAGAAGGAVHMVLGNHEIMNLLGDLAYVSKAEFASYAEDEDPRQRQAALARFRAAAGERGTGNPDADFEQRYPHGFFGHRRLFAAGGDYGRWLLDKPVLLRINDTVFVHGGLSPQLQVADGAAINAAYGKALREYLESMATLSNAGILPPETDFYDHGRVLQSYLDAQAAAGAEVPEPLRRSAQRLIELNASPLFQSRAPIWYRGNVGCGDALAESEVDAALQRLGARRLVIGHTPTRDHQVLSRFNGRLIRADTGMLSSHYGGQASAVIIENGAVSVLYPGQDSAVDPEQQPRRTGARPGNLTDDDLAVLLAQAPIQGDAGSDDGARVLQLGYRETSFKARFTPAVRSRGAITFMPELAAYRLDRMLGLDLVPVTVAREVDGTAGAVSVNPEYLVSEQQRVEQREGGGAWCPLPEQFNLMYVFDILADNSGRRADEVRYERGEWELVLTGNRKLFGTDRDRPRYLRKAKVSLPAALAERLRNLDAAQLERELGGLLDEKQLRAILQRRDRLLKSAVSGG